MEKEVVIAAFAVWAAKQIYEMLRSDTVKNTEATRINTLALTKLETKIEHFSKLLDSIPKMQQDIDSAHKLIRQHIAPRRGFDRQ